MKMNNERYNQIIDDAYEKALMKYGFNWLPGTPPGTHFETQETFINKCKTDSEFSQEFGLKIEERELFMEERWKLADLTPNMTEFDYCNKLCDEHNVPIKLLTITYNNETIEVYG
jgi:hypothetical protein